MPIVKEPVPALCHTHFLAACFYSKSNYWLLIFPVSCGLVLTVSAHYQSCSCGIVGNANTGTKPMELEIKYF